MRAILVDGLNFAYRSHHGHKYLATKDHTPTGVIYATLRLTLDTYKQWPDARLIFCWEGGLGKGGVTPWRREIRGGRAYKATRVQSEDTPIVLKQVDTCMKILHVLGYGQFYVPGLEADDLIGVIATRLASNLSDWDGDHVLILSNDRDYFQCVDTSVSVLRKEGDRMVRITPKKVLEEFCIHPDDWTKYRALVGDVSDNIKGMPGCGPKTAPKLLAAGIDPSLKRFSDHPTRVCKAYANIEEHWASIHTSYLLTYIPRSPTYKLFPEEARNTLKKAMRSCTDKLHRRMTEHEQYRALKEFTSFCADYEMQSLLAERRSFFNTVETIRK
jgi:5'-3' exonuclease